MDATRREAVVGGASLAAGALLWLVGAPSLLVTDARLARAAEGLAEAALAPWEGGSKDRLLGLDRVNPEYDLMTRTFTALALGDLALRDPPRWRARALAALDAMLADTLRAVEDEGPQRFLLPYWAYRRWEGEGRSLFVDGEVLMIAAVRDRLASDAATRAAVERLAEPVARTMAEGPILCAESYPDECWTFCNSVAVAALRVAGLHAELREAWAVSARANLVDRRTGIVVSSFRYDGRPLDGPEGSTIWLVAHMLRLADPAFAASQYELARAAFGRRAFGFGWAREWADGGHGGGDVDSGPIVPVLEASASSSGLAILAARSFGDEAWADELLTSLEVAAVPQDDGPRRAYAASNALGDAVLLAALTVGPLWDAAAAGEV